MNCRSFLSVALIVFAASCSIDKGTSGNGQPSALSSVPAVQLSYRYEPDVPPPEAKPAAKDERNPAVQASFDQNRPTDLVDRMITSPDGKRVAVVYHEPGDQVSEFRLDMYTAEGQPLKRVTSDLMAVHFPDTIRWSPDSKSLAFVAMLRGVPPEPAATPGSEPGGPEPTPSPSPTPVPEVAPGADNSNANANAAEQPADAPPADANLDPNASPGVPAPEAPTGILTFRTEQLYVCGADGEGTRPITQNEGFIYFYYVWSPDSSMLAALALHAREWRELERRANATGAMFVPLGRPRVVETTGRERRLDDGLTGVQPVWSPDSSKVAAGFEHQIRVYDALGNNPTQAAIPLRNPLLLSSQVYDSGQAEKLAAADANQNTEPAGPAAEQNTLPDPSTLVSFNPIVLLDWTSPDLLYFETAYIKRMQNEADSATSFARWHRLVFSPQAVN